MKLSASDLQQLAEVAVSAAQKAGEMIAESRPQKVERKAGAASLASQVVTEVDRRSEEIIVAGLKPTLQGFELGLLTEERRDDGGRLAADHFWCIDPLDGTLPFVEGSPGYAVSIALVGRDGTPHLGVVYDPVEATLWHAISGGGVFRNDRAWRSESQPGGEMLSVFADRSFVERDDHDEVIDALDEMAQGMGLTGVRLDATAGAVMNACGVLSRPPGCYFKYPASQRAVSTGGGSLWDFAATACLFHESGAVASDMAGAALDLNRADSTSMGHRGVLFATDGLLAKRIRAVRRG